MSNGVQYAGEYDLLECKLFSPNGEITDLLTDVVVMEIDMFEDIFMSSISGTVIVIDIKNIISKLPIVGQERLSLKVATPTLEKKEDIIDFTESRAFTVNKVGGRQEISGESQIYKISFVSPELVSNTRKRLSKSYVKSKSNIGEIVFDLLAEDIYGIQTSKEVFIEETVGNRALISTNSNPFEYISRLTKEAISKGGSPHYLFFENKHGIHFRTLQSLYKHPIKAEFHSGDRGFDEYNDPSEINSGKLIQSYKRILQYSLNTKNDLLINSTVGVFGGKVYEHDIYRKKFKVKTFNYFDEEQYNNNERISPNKPYSTNVMGNMDTTLNEEITNSKIHLIPISSNSDDFDSNYELNGTPNQQYKTLLDRQSRFVELYDGISINMTVHGNTTLTAGDMVDISLPTLGDVVDGEENKYYSGKYMIKRLRHIFEAGPSGKLHKINMEVVTDGLPIKIKSGGGDILVSSPTSSPIYV